MKLMILSSEKLPGAYLLTVNLFEFKHNYFSFSKTWVFIMFEFYALFYIVLDTVHFYTSLNIFWEKPDFVKN